MYKCKLQELCQRRSWKLPEYTTKKDGPDHMPRFTSSVDVNELVFDTPASCRSAKEAQNTAARIAFDHLNALPPPTAAADSPPVMYFYHPAYSTPPTAPLPTAVPTVAPPTEVQFVAAAASPVPSASQKPPPAVPSVASVPEVQPTAVAVHTVSPPPSSLPMSAPVPSGAPLPETQPVVAAPIVHSVLQTPHSVPTDSPLAGMQPVSAAPLDHSVSQPPPAVTKDPPGPELQPITAILPVHSVLPPSSCHSMPPPDASRGYYKSRLQQYTQKQNLGLPVYTTENEGPSHARRFKCKVCIGGKLYQTLETFSSLKEAEQAAAKIACQSLFVDATQQDGGFYKNLLRDFTQKKGLRRPSYTTVKSGLPHDPIFASTVEIWSRTFQGAEAKTKKQAEINAAKVAYYAVTASCMVAESLGVSSIEGFPVADDLAKNVQPSRTTEEHDDAISPIPNTKRQDSSVDEGAEKQAKRAKPSDDVEPYPHNTHSASNDLSSPALQAVISTSFGYGPQATT